jgi:hypothetical protein
VSAARAVDCRDAAVISIDWTNLDGFHAGVLEGLQARDANGGLLFYHHGKLMRRNREPDR